MEWFAVVELAVASVIGAILTLAGIALEVIAAEQLSAGAVIEGAWFVAMGALIAYAGIVVLRGRVVGTIAGR